MNGTAYAGTANLPALSNTSHVMAGTVDVGDDGDADVVWRNTSTGANAIWLMNGTSYVSTVNLPTLSNASYRIGGTR